MILLKAYAQQKTTIGKKVFYKTSYFLKLFNFDDGDDDDGGEFLK